MTAEFSNQIPWTEFEPEGLEQFLEKNKRGVSLRKVVTEYLISEAEFLQNQKNMDLVSIDGLDNFYSDMEQPAEFFDEGWMKKLRV